ncbi:glycosyltransferase family 25 protein [Hoeflea sp.]|uniref:glycosyltransferase family 25 protein n=1 Tax=Hoeflea sp. TaxID=1940281 RepID=UPI0037497C6E
MNGDIEAFIIHLARATGRRSHVDRLLEVCPVPAKVLDAVDGRALSQAEIDSVYTRDSLHAPHYPFEMTVGEVGCFLSHRKAWQAIVDSGKDAGLVIEDDVEIDPKAFPPALALARQHVAELGYIQFQTRPVRSNYEVVFQSAGTSLVKPLICPLRTSAQIVSAAHARHLLDLTARIDRPVDGFLQLSWATSLPVCCAVPSGVGDRTMQAGGSTISVQKNSIAGNLVREVKRFVYRKRVRSRSESFARQAGG